MNTTFVIGDIHGAFKALVSLIEKLSLRKNDQIIFLGDYVDGWPESASTIDYLIELDQSYKCIFIKGNHDAWCELWLDGETANETWLLHGGIATIESYTKKTPSVKALHSHFFKRMPNYYIDEKNRLFIHAGFSSVHGPERERYESNYSFDRTLWELALSLDPAMKKDSRFYPKRLLLFKEIFIGHTPTTNYNIDIPMQASNVWNVDTGAAFYGKISALDIETGEFFQSEACYQLYPNEKGRN